MANEMTVQKTESLSNSEAFTNKVLKEFGSNVAGQQLKKRYLQQRTIRTQSSTDSLQSRLRVCRKN